MKITFDDDEIIKGLKSFDERLRDRMLAYLYNTYFNDMTNHISYNNKLSRIEAEDIFQEGIIAMYENIQNNKFNSQSSIKTYLSSIIRNITFSVINKTSKVTITVDVSVDYDYLSDFSNDGNEEKAKFLEQAINNLGENCKNILVDYYYHKTSMSEIAGKYRFSNEESAKTQKYKCLKKLIDYIDSKPLLKEQLQGI